MRGEQGGAYMLAASLLLAPILALIVWYANPLLAHTMIFIVHSVWMQNFEPPSPELPSGSLNGQVAIVTGGGSGLGVAIASEFARKGAHVIITVRHELRGEQGLERIRRALNQSSSTKVEYAVMDNADLHSVQKFARNFVERRLRLDILVTNAARVFGELKLIHGIESKMLINHLSHFLLVRELSDLLVNSAPSRVVIISAAVHELAQHVDLRYLYPASMEGKGAIESYKDYLAYIRSKIANVLHMLYLHQRLGPRGVRVVALHPGLIDTWVTSTLQAPRWVQAFLKYLSGLTVWSPREGSMTCVGLAGNKDLPSGRFFLPTSHAVDLPDWQCFAPHMVARLAEWSVQQVDHILALVPSQ